MFDTQKKQMKTGRINMNLETKVEDKNGAKRGKNIIPLESAGKVETRENVIGQKNNSFALIGYRILPRSQRGPPQPLIQSHCHCWLQVP